MLSKNIYILWRSISLRNKKFLLVTLFGMILSSIFEVVSIGSVIPFISFISGDQIKILNFFNLQEINLGVVTLIFCAAVILSAATRFIVLWGTTKVAFLIGQDLSIYLYRILLNQDFEYHTSRNSSAFIDLLVNKINDVIQSIIMPFLSTISSAVMMMFIGLLIIAINPAESTIAILFFGCIYVIIIKLTKGVTRRGSLIISTEGISIIKILQESFGAIRDIILNNNKKYYLDSFQTANNRLRAAQISVSIIGAGPKFLVETCGIILIATLAYLGSKANGNFSPLANIAAVALGLQRLLPLAQQTYWGMNEMRGRWHSLADIVDMIKIGQNLRHLPRKEIYFRDEILVKDLFFGYKNKGKNILSNVNFKIKKGDRVGIVGKTGAGKSTLVDVVVGLLEASKGGIFVDGEKISHQNIDSWRNNIAYVPQHIFLIDATIAENIALGLNGGEINPALVRDVIKKAELFDFIDDLPEGINTVVGERGVQLSGGQRQRIGIARALYQEKSVIILDEATSALDEETERAITRTIDNLDKKLTIFTIAHRLSTLKNCNYLIEVSLDGVAIKR
jgi:ABC-type multidrug transport system fused ATPase/permease subunit